MNFTSVDEMKSTLKQMFDMMKEAETARENDERNKVHQNAAQKSKGLPSMDIGGSLGVISMPFGSIGSLGMPFGSKKTEETPKETTDDTNA